MHASGWMYSSRALVFGWALLLTHQFGIAEYGVYAIAFAAGAIIGVPLDSYFTVRTPRVSERVFAGERTTRVLIGLGLVFLGWALWPFTFLGGFAVGKAGIDVCFQASRSPLIRAGHPDRAQRADAARQIFGIALGTAYVLFYPGAIMEVAALLYLAGCASPILIGVRNLVDHRPIRPELTVRTASILGESIGGVAYVQAEVILLGLLASPTSAGYYSFGATIVWSLASLGQSFAYTYHEGMRHSQGDVDTGPPLRTALRLSAATASHRGGHRRGPAPDRVRPGPVVDVRLARTGELPAHAQQRLDRRADDAAPRRLPAEDHRDQPRGEGRPSSCCSARRVVPARRWPSWCPTSSCRARTR